MAVRVSDEHIKLIDPAIFSMADRPFAVIVMVELGVMREFASAEIVPVMSRAIVQGHSDIDYGGLDVWSKDRNKAIQEISV